MIVALPRVVVIQESGLDHYLWAIELYGVHLFFSMAYNIATTKIFNAYVFKALYVN